LEHFKTSCTYLNKQVNAEGLKKVKRSSMSATHEILATAYLNLNCLDRCDNSNCTFNGGSVSFLEKPNT